MEKLTPLFVSENVSSIQEGIEFIESHLGEHPKKPKRPTLTNPRPSAEDAYEFAKLMEEYEAKLPQYEKELAEYRENENVVYDSIRMYILDQSGALDHVPQQYLDKVYSYAYEEGHSDGHYNVFLKLSDLVTIFM